MGAIVFEENFMVSRQFSSGAINLRDNCPGCNYTGGNHPGGNCPGSIFQLSGHLN